VTSDKGDTIGRSCPRVVEHAGDRARATGIPRAGVRQQPMCLEV